MYVAMYICSFTVHIYYVTVILIYTIVLCHLQPSANICLFISRVLHPFALQPQDSGFPERVCVCVCV